MDPHQSGDQSQQHQLTPGDVSTRPNPEAQPPAQEGEGWQVAPQHSSAGKRAAHERARASSDAGRSPAANKSRHHDPAQMNFMAQAQGNPFAPLAAQDPQTTQGWWGMQQAINMPAAVYSNPQSNIPSHHPSPLHSEASGMVRHKLDARMDASHYTQPAFRLALLVPA